MGWSLRTETVCCPKNNDNSNMYICHALMGAVAIISYSNLTYFIWIFKCDNLQLGTKLAFFLVLDLCQEVVFPSSTN